MTAHFEATILMLLIRLGQKRVDSHGNWGLWGRKCRAWEGACITDQQTRSADCTHTDAHSVSIGLHEVWGIHRKLAGTGIEYYIVNFILSFLVSLCLLWSLSWQVTKHAASEKEVKQELQQKLAQLESVESEKHRLAVSDSLSMHLDS